MMSCARHVLDFVLSYRFCGAEVLGTDEFAAASAVLVEVPVLRFAGELDLDQVFVPFDLFDFPKVQVWIDPTLIIGVAAKAFNLCVDLAFLVLKIEVDVHVVQEGQLDYFAV